MNNNFRLLQTTIKNNLIITEVNHYYYKNFNYIKALENINFLFNTGKIYGLIGPSGCGKTTLANILSGRLKASSGIVRFGNFPIDNVDDRFELANRIQLVSQNSSMSLNQIRTGWSLLRDVADYKDIANLIPLFNLSLDILSKPVYTYSGGEKQRLNLLRTWLVNSNILILDESFSALDENTKHNISKLIIKEKINKIIIFITHDISVMLNLCEELIFMFDGKIVQHLKTYQEEEIYNIFADHDELKDELKHELKLIRKAKKTKLFYRLLDLLNLDNQ